MKVITAKQSAQLLDALQELVQLKEYKDVNGKNDAYEDAKPAAWNKAKRVLESIKLNEDV